MANRQLGKDEKFNLDIANTIKAYWKKRGATVNTTVNTAHRLQYGETVYNVKSDMINGLPRSKGTSKNFDLT